MIDHGRATISKCLPTTFRRRVIGPLTSDQDGSPPRSGTGIRISSLLAWALSSPIRAVETGTPSRIW
jgi:hypothetical protein